MQIVQPGRNMDLRLIDISAEHKGSCFRPLQQVDSPVRAGVLAQVKGVSAGVMTSGRCC